MPRNWRLIDLNIHFILVNWSDQQAGGKKQLGRSESGANL